MVISAPTSSERAADRSQAIDNRDLSERVYQVLKLEIVQGILPPGSRLSLDDLAQRFGVSASPIRDSLRLLAADNLVELRSRRGAFVTQPSLALIQEIFEIRAILECAAVDRIVTVAHPALNTLRTHVDQMPATMVGESHDDYLAYIRHDQQFHQTLIDSIENSKLSEIYAELASFSLIARMLHHASNHRATETLAEHRRILAALDAGDAGTARAAVRAHLENACAHLMLRSSALADERSGNQDKNRRSIPSDEVPLGL